MFGVMQDVPLLVNRILDHALVNHPEREIVSRLVEGNIHRETYADAHLRSRKLSQSLQALGFQQGDVLATLAWNTHRHFEAWYGITGIGGVYHTLNPRLFADQSTLPLHLLFFRIAIRICQPFHLRRTKSDLT